MDYYGIKTPPRDCKQQYVWWISNSSYGAWQAFFTYPNKDGEMNAHRPPLADAILAYEGIGYQCVALDVQEKPNG